MESDTQNPRFPRERWNLLAPARLFRLIFTTRKLVERVVGRTSSLSMNALKPNFIRGAGSLMCCRLFAGHRIRSSQYG
jgi:hypothetical protein